MPSGNSEMQGCIVSYCMDFFLPIQVHQYPDMDRIDQSHIISMSLHSPALMNILLANAAKTWDSSSYWRFFAMESYIRAVQQVRQIIKLEGLNGREDSLLGTIMWLCIFEVRELVL